MTTAGLLNFTPDDWTSATPDGLLLATLDATMPTLAVTATAHRFKTLAKSLAFESNVTGGVPPYAYLWSMDGFGPAIGPTHSVRVPAAGTYTANLAVEDAAGTIARTSVTFEFPQVPTSVVVTPTVPAVHVPAGLLGQFIGTITTGTTRQFQAVVKDQFGTLISNAAVTWSATGTGTVSNGGLFTATSVGSATLTASSDMAIKTVTFATVASAGVSVAYPSTIKAGLRQAVTLIFGGVVPPAPVTIAASVGTVGPISHGGFLVSFLYTAPTAAGPVTFTVGGLTATATVSTSAPGVRWCSITVGGAGNPRDPDGRLVTFASLKGHPGLTVIREDTGESLVVPFGVPWLRSSVGRYEYAVSEVAPTVDYRLSFGFTKDGSWQAGEFSFKPGAPTGAATTITVTDCDSSDPIPHMVVWATSDAQGATVVAGPAFTTTQGTAVLQLIAGTNYYLFGLKVGEYPIAAQPFTAVAD